tara:strand:+ start:991 stop:2028 length:1038 start_codon:yes stop_codon:yes gene_type:complete
MPFTNIDKSTAHFNTKTFTGNGSTQSITGVGFQPDWVWFKNRSSAQNHRLFDAVRGAGKNLKSNGDTAEIDAGTGTSGQLRTFDSDGFSVGSDGSVNNNSENIGAWNWKAGNSAGSSNSNGSITSTVSVNTTAGFSIVTYTGTGSTATVGHGLGVVPSMIIIKRRDDTDDWQIYHKSIGNTKYLAFNSTAAATTSSTRWNDTTPTNSVFTVGTAGATNGSGRTFVAYCFAEKAGFSKFGEYVGNANADGRFIQTNFAVNFLMVKEYGATGNWLMWDNTTHNWNRTYRMANATDADNSADNVSVDLLSNGFKWRGNAGDSNGSGNILYMAFGQSIVGSNNTPALAR